MTDGTGDDHALVVARTYLGAPKALVEAHTDIFRLQVIAAKLVQENAELKGQLKEVTGDE